MRARTNKMRIAQNVCLRGTLPSSYSTMTPHVIDTHMSVGRHLFMADKLRDHQVEVCANNRL